MRRIPSAPTQLIPLILLILSSYSPAVAGGRSLIYREVNLAGIYSHRSASLDFHPMAPHSAAGFELLWKNSAGTPGRLNPDAADLHLQFVYDPVDDRVETRFQDAWVRFTEPTSGLQVRLGHFNLPFGLNPVAEPRGEVLQPLAALDLGFKKDWGLAVQGQWHGFACETAATFGTADELRRRRGRYLWSGRIGIPTYRDVQYGISLLYGTTSATGQPTSWRLAMDLVYMYHEPFTTIKGEVAFGADGHTPVQGLLAGLTQILPAYPLWGIETQFRAWRRELQPEDLIRAESAIGLWRSLPGLLILRLHWRRHFSTESLHRDDQLFAQLYYYGY